jgi:hypothetical protein
MKTRKVLFFHLMMGSPLAVYAIIPTVNMKVILVDA